MGYEERIKKQLESMDLGELEQILEDAEKQSRGIFSDFSTQQMIDSFLTGTPIFDPDLLIRNIADVFLYEIKGGLLLGVQLISICIVIGLLQNLSGSFGNQPVSSLGTAVCSCLVITLCLKNFVVTYESCIHTIDLMTGTMQVLLPIMIPLLISMGGFSSGGALHPVILGTITAFNTALQKCILPIVYISTIFLLINSMTEKDYVKKLAGFLRRSALFLTGLAVTLFTGITAIQGLVTKTADGLLMNTARFSVDHFVPIVGKFAADSIDMVLSCIGVIKNGIGIIGIIIILSLLVVPVIKIAAIAVIYKVTAIVIEPIGNKSVSDCLTEMGNAVVTMAVILALCALMFLIFLTIIISMGGGSLWKS